MRYSEETYLTAVYTTESSTHGFITPTKMSSRLLARENQLLHTFMSLMQQLALLSLGWSFSSTNLISIAG